MRKAIVAALAAWAVAGVPTTQVGAGGGGGSYEPLTEANGTVVAMQDYCFRPAILYVPPGENVTWVNRDQAPHVVIGANDVFGRYREYELGDTVTFSFRKQGVYPYLCSYHPGMAGAVVVGDVRPPIGSVKRLIPPGAASGVDPITSYGYSPVTSRGEAPIAPRAVSSAGPWKAAAGISLGLLLVTLVAVALRRRPTS
jgi:plastocyanin